MTPTLPQAEIDRIAADANSKWPLDENDPPTKYTSSRNALMLDFRSAFIAGAQAEVVRGREQERTRFIEFLQWLSAEKAEYSILYGGDPERFCSIDHDYTSEQIADLYILETLKRKG